MGRSDSGISSLGEMRARNGGGSVILTMLFFKGVAGANLVEGKALELFFGVADNIALLLCTTTTI